MGLPLAALAVLLLILATQGRPDPRAVPGRAAPVTGLLIGANLGAFVVAFLAGTVGIIALGRTKSGAVVGCAGVDHHHPGPVRLLHPPDGLVVKTVPIGRPNVVTAPRSTTQGPSTLTRTSPSPTRKTMASFGSGPAGPDVVVGEGLATVHPGRLGSGAVKRIRSDRECPAG